MDPKHLQGLMEAYSEVYAPINYFDKLTKKNKNEEVEIFDTVLEFLQVEGYAETLEEAEWLMANVIDEEAIEIVLGSKYSTFNLTH